MVLSGGGSTPREGRCSIKPNTGLAWPERNLAGLLPIALGAAKMLEPPGSFVRTQAGSGKLALADNVIRPKPVLPEFVARQSSLLSYSLLVN